MPVSNVFRCFLVCLCLVSLTARAEVITLKNGMRYEGRAGEIASLGADPARGSGAGQLKVKQIVFLDDGLRRSFFSSIQVQAIGPGIGESNVSIQIPQRACVSGRRVGGIGPIIKITPFDDWGRRTFSMSTARGRVDVIQAMTEVTPIYTKLEGMLVSNCFVWDMRIATSSIPRETLSRVLKKAIDPQNPTQRLDIVRLYIQSERYEDARAEMKEMLADFEGLTNLQKQLAAMTQLSSQRLIKEVEIRRAAGQDVLAFNILNQFPDEGVAGATLIQVRDELAKYDKIQNHGKQVLELLSEHLAALDDATTRAALQPVHEEIKRRLNIHTLDRFADYLRLSEDEELKADQLVALAVSGWLLGSGAGEDNLAVAMSLVQVRDKVREYLNTTTEVQRERILADLESLEGSTPDYLAKLVAQMEPPVATEQQESEIPGLLKLTTKGLPAQPEMDYYVQLPPEYDPFRRYPCVVTLNGSAVTALQQIDWWAGDFNAEREMRLGQATRRGYIVVAPVWTEPYQLHYGYTAREHAAVLNSLRDACKRFSIDTDRVFLSGHSMGGDAAWDIALSHPDLWAGVIPIVANHDKYIPRYWENGRDVPMYFVGGQLDGDWMPKNGPELDRYLTKHTFDCTVVEYQGRGHEHFQDEIQRIFEWMDVHRRDFFKKEFLTMSMRTWDNFFWCVELDEFPERSIVPPALWPPDRGVRPAMTECRVLETNGITVQSAAADVTVWLSPEIVDFNQRISINVNRRGRTYDIQPSTRTLLEDVRTRGDRQHPFWAKVSGG